VFLQSLLRSKWKENQIFEFPALNPGDSVTMPSYLTTKSWRAWFTWFMSYLSNRSQRVSLNGCISDSFRLPHGVPQGSCLGPLLFTIYSSKLFEVIKYHLPQAHAYADDTQLYLSFSPDSEEAGQSSRDNFVPIRCFA